MSFSANSVAIKVHKAVGQYGAKNWFSYPMSLDEVENKNPDKKANLLFGVYWEYKKDYAIYPGAPANFTAHFLPDAEEEITRLCNLLSKDTVVEEDLAGYAVVKE